MNITLYTSKTCFHCFGLKKKLNEMNVPYEEIDTINLSPEEMDQIIEEAGTSALPIIETNNEYVNEPRLMELIKEFKEKVPTCHDCGKEIVIDEEGNIENGLSLKYDKGDGKFIEVFKCKECYEKDPALRNFQQTEVYSRVVGYIRPVSQWNTGKQAEFDERETFKM